MIVLKKVNPASSPAASVGIEKHQPRSDRCGAGLLKKQKRRRKKKNVRYDEINDLITL